MCGIVAAALPTGDVAGVLIAGLKELEYRGYDSAGIAVRQQDGSLTDTRVVGKVAGLETRLRRSPLKGAIGIGHTRWATHGKVEESNAHPHSSADRLFVVHNGIIENHEELRAELLEQGFEFSSETDSEVLAKLIDRECQAQKGDVRAALRQSLSQVRGSYALVVLHKSSDTLYGALHGCPLILGLGDDGEHYLASDVAALQGYADEVIYLSDGQIAEVQSGGYRIEEDGQELLVPDIQPIPKGDFLSSRGNYQHYMEKEIHDIPEVVRETLSGVVTTNRVIPQALGSISDVLSQIEEVHLVACGSAHFASCLGADWFTSIVGIPATAYIASEFRYSSMRPRPNTLLIAVSQSGETADTLGCLEVASERGYLTTLALCNVPWSLMYKHAEHVLLTRAGKEVCVLSTKAMLAQALSLLLLALGTAESRGGQPPHATTIADDSLITELLRLDVSLEKVIKDLHEPIKQWARELAEARTVFYLGRGAHFTVALEGALKLKEGAYIHAEAYPAGELKHGPLALVESGVPAVVTLSADKEPASKTLSNLSEVLARGGKAYLLSPKDAPKAPKEVNTIHTPCTHPKLQSLLHTTAVQLLAYEVALLRGTDIDQPRNLAKSVTVE